VAICRRERQGPRSCRCRTAVPGRLRLDDRAHPPLNRPSPHESDRHFHPGAGRASPATSRDNRPTESGCEEPTLRNASADPSLRGAHLLSKPPDSDRGEAKTQPVEQRRRTETPSRPDPLAGSQSNRKVPATYRPASEWHGKRSKRAHEHHQTKPAISAIVVPQMAGGRSTDRWGYQVLAQ